MIADHDFDHFLKNGYIHQLLPGTSMHVLLNKYGDKNWIAKEKEFNGLIYGIIKIGFIEFHIYNEKLNAVSYRPDIHFPMSDFNNVTMPWIYPDRDMATIEENLIAKKIAYTKYVVQGPMEELATAGAELFGLEEGEIHFIDTEGGVTFIFEDDPETNKLVAYHICKYYDIQKQPM